MYQLPFEIKSCPQECGAVCGTKLEKCPILAKLPADFQEVCKTNLHLLQYIYMLPLDKMEIPKYYEKVTRKLKGTKDPNLIYGIGNQVFVHILANPEDIRDYYIAVEPSIIDAQDSTLDEIETYLADYVEELEGVSDSTKRLEIILKIIDKIVVVGGGSKKPPPLKPKQEKSAAGGDHHDKGIKTATKVKEASKGKIRITQFQYNSLKYLLRRKLDGMGVMDPMILDPNIEDISCSGLGNIFVEHKIFGGLRTSIGFETNEILDKFVIELAEGIKHPVTSASRWSTPPCRTAPVLTSSTARMSPKEAATLPSVNSVIRL